MCSPPCGSDAEDWAFDSPRVQPLYYDLCFIQTISLRLTSVIAMAKPKKPAPLPAIKPLGELPVVERLDILTAPMKDRQIIDLSEKDITLSLSYFTDLGANAMDIESGSGIKLKLVSSIDELGNQRYTLNLNYDAGAKCLQGVLPLNLKLDVDQYNALKNLYDIVAPRKDAKKMTLNVDKSGANAALDALLPRNKEDLKNSSDIVKYIHDATRIGDSFTGLMMGPGSNANISNAQRTK